MTISQFIQSRLDTGKYQRSFDIGKELNMSAGQVSHYHTGRTKQPNLDVCQDIYSRYDVVIWPYSLEAVSGVSDE